jgi:hypothetical protein
LTDFNLLQSIASSGRLGAFVIKICEPTRRKTKIARLSASRQQGG